MRSASTAFSEAVSARCRRINHSRITVGSTVLTGDNVKKISITEAVCDGDVMMPGCVCSAQAQLTVTYQSGMEYTGKKVVAERGIETANGIEYVLLGTFWVTDPTSSDDYRTVDLVCQDAIVKFGGEYKPTVVFPALLGEVFQDVCTQAGVPLQEGIEFPAITLLEKPEGYTQREMLGYLAGMCGKYAKATRDGEITIGWFTESGETVQTENIALGGFRRLNDVPIRSRFSVYTDLGETVATDEPTDEEANWISYLQDPRPITGLNKWAIVNDHMYCFSDDVSATAGSISEFDIAASSILCSVNALSDSTYPNGWGGFEDETDWGLAVDASDITAANFALNTDEGVEAIGYTNGAAHIGKNYGPPSSGAPLMDADRYAWKVQNYLTKCPFDTYNPDIDGSYSDSTLALKPVAFSDLPKNWVLYYVNEKTNVELMDGSAEIVEPNLSLVFADHFYFERNPSVNGNTNIFRLNTSLPRYTFTFGAPHDDASGEHIWRLSEYREGSEDASYGDWYGFTAYVTGENVDFLFKTKVIAASCNLYSTANVGDDYAAQLLFRATLEENLHDCGTTILPGGGDPSNPDSGETDIKYDSGAMDYTNPLITAAMLNTIQSLMPVTEYMPCRVQWRGNPAFESGDLVTVVDRYGNKWLVPIMQQTMSFQGGLTATIEAPGMTEEAAKFSQSSTTDRSIRRVRADLKRQKATS